MGTVQERARRRGQAHRLEAETSALREVFDEAGYYEVRTPQGITRRLFVVSSRPWRFAELLVKEAPRDAE